MARNDSFMKKNYDKLLAAALLVLCAAAVYFWVSSRAEPFPAVSAAGAHGPGAGRPLDVAAYHMEAGEGSNITARLFRPRKMKEMQRGVSGFFTPEKRIWCARGACRAPIPFDSEVCPHCGTEQPTLRSLAANEATIDSDGDGMPDVWEKKYGLNLQDPEDAGLDMDGDGFTNLEEFIAGTDPTDAKSHPDMTGFLRVVEIDTTKLPVKFMSAMKMGKEYKYQFNYFDKELGKTATFFIKAGERLGPLDRLPGMAISEKRYSDYRLVEVQWREEKGINRFTKKEEMQNVAVAIVERVSTGRKTELRENADALDSNYKIALLQTRTGEEYLIDGDENSAGFKIDGKDFTLKEVDKTAKTVVIISVSDKKEFKIPPAD